MIFSHFSKSNKLNDRFKRFSFHVFYIKLISSFSISLDNRLRTEFEVIQQKEDAANEGNLKVTASMMRTVFLEIKKNIPFDTHANLVDLQVKHGVNLGYHHFERSGAIAMLESMSNYMHKLLLKHMISKNLPFSIILDGSTDKQGNKYIIIYFQILENNIPVMCFYRLVEASSDVTANGLYI